MISDAIEACGGKIVSKAPNKNSGFKYVVIASEENRNKYGKLLKQKTPVTVVNPEAIFDGVLRQEVQFEQHRLL